jgi:predicted enzyme related to lactoylglutathione lyase
VDDELMTIGRFAQLSGLSIGTLRHYDEVGLLAPAETDPASGYRRYRRDQLRRTWLIRSLRWLDLPSGCRPCQIKIAVKDKPAAAAFYQEAFGLRHAVIRRAGDAEYHGFMFGEYGRDDFFLLNLVEDDNLDLPGPSTFGLLVDDLDTYHARAVAAGATETVKPHDPVGMPRCSAVRDPSGNLVWLYQA